MAKRMSVTERVLEDRPVGRGFEAIIGEAREENNTGRQDAAEIEHAESQSAAPHSGNLIKRTFLLDPESLEILERIWLRQQKRDGHSKSELVREAIRWFRAKPGNRMEQIVETISSLVNRTVLTERGASRPVIAGVASVVATFVGSIFMGGALWLAQGAHRGAGDAMGIGILASLGATLILLALGAALTGIVTYVAGLPEAAAPGGAAAPQHDLAEESDEATPAARRKPTSG